MHSKSTAPATTSPSMFRLLQISFVLQFLLNNVDAGMLRQQPRKDDCNKATDTVEILQYQMRVDLLQTATSQTCSQEELKRIGLVMQSTMAQNDELRREFEIINLENHLCPQPKSSFDEEAYHYVFRGGGKCHFCYTDNNKQQRLSSSPYSESQRLRQRRLNIQEGQQQQQLRQLKMHHHEGGQHHFYSLVHNNNNDDEEVLDANVSPSLEYFQQKVPALEWSLGRHLEDALANAFVHSPQSCLYAVNPDDIEVAVQMKLFPPEEGMSNNNNCP